jgi:hypothetical protein
LLKEKLAREKERENERELRRSSSHHSLASHHSISSHQSYGTHQSRERSRQDSRGYTDKRDRSDRPSSSSRLSVANSREDLRPVVEVRGRQTDYPRYNRYNDRPGAVEPFDRRHAPQPDRERSRDRFEERPSKFGRSDIREWHGERDRSRDQPMQSASRHSYGGRPAQREYHRDEKPYRK